VAAAVAGGRDSSCAYPAVQLINWLWVRMSNFWD
jgi:hypothetical protein